MALWSLSNWQSSEAVNQVLVRVQTKLRTMWTLPRGAMSLHNAQKRDQEDQRGTVSCFSCDFVLLGALNRILEAARGVPAAILSGKTYRGNRSLCTVGCYVPLAALYQPWLLCTYLLWTLSVFQNQNGPPYYLFGNSSGLAQYFESSMDLLGNSGTYKPKQRYITTQEWYV